MWSHSLQGAPGSHAWLHQHGICHAVPCQLDTHLVALADASVSADVATGSTQHAYLRYGVKVFWVGLAVLADLASIIIPFHASLSSLQAGQVTVLDLGQDMQGLVLPAWGCISSGITSVEGLYDGCGGGGWGAYALAWWLVGQGQKPTTAGSCSSTARTGCAFCGSCSCTTLELQCCCLRVLLVWRAGWSAGAFYWLC